MANVHRVPDSSLTTPAAPAPRRGAAPAAEALPLSSGAGRARPSGPARLASGTWTSAALLSTDLAALAAAALTTGAAFFLAGRPLGANDLFLMIAIGLLIPPAFRAVHLYPGEGLGRVEEFRRMSLVSVGVISVFAIAVALASFGPGGGVDPAPILAMGVAQLAFAPTARALTRQRFSTRPWWGVPVVIFGAGACATRLIEVLQRTPGIGLRPVACFDDDVATHDLDIHGIPVVGPPAHAVHYRAIGVRHALVALSADGPRMTPRQRTHFRAFPSVVIIPDLKGLDNVSGATLALGSEIGLHVRQNLLLRRNRFVKRVLDLVLMVPAALVAVPIVAVCALWIRVTSPGSPFYFQQREGLGGRPIKVWKLRTMHHDADSLLERHLNENPAVRTEWETRYKLVDDPRVLPGIGKLLRRTSLDELPQLWNIARGEMSFIGPRPFPYYHLSAFGDDFLALRRTALPGLSGLWQVSVRGDGSIGAQQELDTRYINEWSIWMDLYVLARTPLVVLQGKGAY